MITEEILNVIRTYLENPANPLYWQVKEDYEFYLRMERSGWGSGYRLAVKNLKRDYKLITEV